MRFRMLVGVLLLMVIAVPNAQGDGCYIPRLDTVSARASYTADISEPEQKAAIAYFDGQERLILQVSYKGKASEFVWLVPTPSKPIVVKCDFPVFHMLHEATLPRLKFWFDSDKRIHDFSKSRGGLVGRVPSVEVMERKALGLYDVAVLRARNAGDLISWLKTNGYMVKPAMEPVLSDYINRGWVFTAAKIKPGKSVREGQLDALQFDFHSDEPVYPLKISSLNPGRTKILLYVLAEHRVDAPSLKTVLVGSKSDISHMFNPGECIAAFYWDGKGYYDSQTLPYVTKLTGDLSTSQMNDDIVLRRSRTDDTVEPTVPAPIWENLWSILAFGFMAVAMPPLSIVIGAILAGIGMTRWGRRRQLAYFCLAILFFLPMVLLLLGPMMPVLLGVLIIWLIISIIRDRNTDFPPDS